MAREIVLDQAPEISTMNSYLHQAGTPKSANDDGAMDWMDLPVPISRMPGMPTTTEMNQLRSPQGLDADEVFTRLMINHHAAGVAMADYEAEHGENDNVKRLAAAMARLQRSELAEMNTRRRALGLEPVDANALENLHSHAG